MKSMRAASGIGLMVLALAGCGGGSGSSGPTASGGSGQGGSSGAVQPQPKLTINAKQYSSSCGMRREPLAGLTVLVHKDDGKILQTHQTAADGKLSVDWPSDARHVTLVHRTSTGRYQLQSYYQLSQTDLGDFSFPDPALTARCGCKQLTVDWQDIQKTMPEYRLLYSGDIQRQSFGLVPTVSTTPVYICPTQDNQFGKLQLLLSAGSQSQSYQSEVDLDALAGKTNLQLKMSDFRQAGRLVNVSNNQGNGSLLHASMVYGNNGIMMRLNQPASVSGSVLRLFDMPGSKTTLNTERSYRLGSLFYTSSVVQVVPESTKSLTVTTPDNLALIAQKLQSLLSASETASSVEYDLSGIGPYQLMTISMGNDNFHWGYNAPIKGKIVDLQLPDSISKIYEDADFGEVYLDLDGMKGASDYASFLKLDADFRRDKSVLLKNPAFEELYHEFLVIEL